MNKKCVKCKKAKPQEEFYAHRTTKDKLNTYCKLCTIEAAKDSRKRKRERLGEAEFKRQQAEYVREYRQFTQNSYDRSYQKARNKAIQELIRRHRTEFKNLMKKFKEESKNEDD